MTSFKAAQLARGLPEIDKVLFVVDRKDLDYQTMREYERFEKGAANSNTSTAVLQRQLENPNARIIITTIQKLSRFVTKNKKHPVYDAHVVVIFDECHRSQFGDMHAEITRVFKRYHLFGNKDAKDIVLLKPYAEYYKEYQKRIEELVEKFPLGKAIVGEAAQKAFIKLFGSILRLKNILTAFDDFAGNEILSQRDFQDYQSLYLNLYAEFRSTSESEKESINDDVVFEIELIKQVEINVDYILMLVEKYLKKKGSGDDKEIRATIERAINASPSLRNKKDLIEQFVDSVSVSAKVDAEWVAFITTKKAEELDRIIADEGLNEDETKAFVDNAFRDGAIPATGTAITKILPPVSRFNKNNGHAVKKQTVLDKLGAFFERFFGLI